MPPEWTRFFQKHVGFRSHGDQLAGFVEVACLRVEAIAAVRGPKRAASSDGTFGGAVAAGCFQHLDLGHIPACLDSLELGRIRQTLVSRAEFLERPEAEGISGWRRGPGRLARHRCHQQAGEYRDAHDVSLRLPSMVRSLPVRARPHRVQRLLVDAWIVLPDATSWRPPRSALRAPAAARSCAQRRPVVSTCAAQSIAKQ